MYSAGEIDLKLIPIQAEIAKSQISLKIFIEVHFNKSKIFLLYFNMLTHAYSMSL